jgi:hypothetical protein
MTIASSDSFTQGLEYLHHVREFAVEPDIICQGDDPTQRVSICTWIGEHIESINRQLNVHLQACHQCFHPWEQPPVQVYAAPLDQAYGLDALCNFRTRPFTLLIDVGRAEPVDWLLLVVHEYAHAHAGSPGHHLQFARSLTHLCLALEIAPPVCEPGMEDSLRFYPDYLATQDPLKFWRGEGKNWRSIETNFY